MRSKFSIYGHPFHPLLVALPIGLFAWTFVADIIYIASDKDHTWYDISLWSGAAAVVTALIAALPGFGDYFTIGIKSEARVMGAAHMLLNLATVGLFAIALLMMIDNNAVDGTNLAIVVVLHALAVGLLTVSGVLGGEMTFRHHLAVIPHAGEVEQEEERHRAETLV
jgi:uncharacterized membrane protein